MVVEEEVLSAGAELNLKVRITPGSTLQTGYHPVLDTLWWKSKQRWSTVTLRADAIHDLGDRWYGMTFKLSPYLRAGKYCIWSLKTRELQIKASDTSGCEAELTAVYQGTVIPVIRRQLNSVLPVDDTAPVVTSATFPVTTVATGHSLPFRVRTVEEGVGIDTEKFERVVLRRTTGEEYLALRGRFRSVGENEYELRDLLVPGGANPGTYAVVFFQIHDLSDNMAQYEVDQAAGSSPLLLKTYSSDLRIEAPLVTILR